MSLSTLPVPALCSQGPHPSHEQLLSGLSNELLSAKPAGTKSNTSFPTSAHFLRLHHRHPCLSLLLFIHLQQACKCHQGKGLFRHQRPRLNSCLHSGTSNWHEFEKQNTDFFQGAKLTQLPVAENKPKDKEHKAYFFQRHVHAPGFLPCWQI